MVLRVLQAKPVLPVLRGPQVLLVQPVPRVLQVKQVLPVKLGRQVRKALPVSLVL